MDAYRNDMLHNYLRVLLTKENTNQLKLSIDVHTDNVKAVLKDIEKGVKQAHAVPFGVYTPSYQEARKAEYTVGKSGIGPFALNNAHHILTLLTGLHMVSNAFTEALDITDVSRITDTPVTGVAKGGRILDWLSAMINGFVDIAKDPYITRLNVNAWTYNMTAFLLRTGKGALTFYFLCLPILKEMADAVLKTKGKYGIDRSKTPSQLEQEAIESILDKYDPDKQLRKKYLHIIKDNLLAATTYVGLFDPEIGNLRGILKQDPNKASGLSFNEEQVRIYYAWKAIEPYANALANLVKYSKIDTKRAGKSFAEWLVYYNGMEAMKDDPHFKKGAVRKFFNETFILKKTDNTLPFGISIFKNLLLRNTDTFISQLNAILSLLGRLNNADASLLNAVISNMEGLIKAEFFADFAKLQGIDIPGMFKGRRSMAKRINNFLQLIRLRNPRLVHLLNDDGSFTNDFISYLIPNISDGTINDGLDFVDVSGLLDKDQATANNLINYWRELIDDPDPLISRLFKDLVVYAFFTSADKPGMNTFFLYVPNSYRQEIGYTDYIQRITDNLSNSASNYTTTVEDIFLNNWTNDKLVRPVQFSDSKHRTLLGIYYNSTIPNIIAGRRLGANTPDIKPSTWATVFDPLTGAPHKEPVFPPYIKIYDGTRNANNSWHVYKLIGMSARNVNRKVEYTPIYGLISKKGYKYRGHQIYEYGTDISFNSNKETVWDYEEAMRNPDLVKALASEYEQESWNRMNIQPLTQVTSYLQLNADATQDMVFEETESNTEESEHGVLEVKEEPNNIQPQSSTETIRQSLNTRGFLGYVGGFSNEGKGTVLGDGKDKAMREIADGFIGELSKSPYKKQGDNFVLKDPDSSTFTSLITIMKKGHNPGTYGDGTVYEGLISYNLGYLSGSKMVMAVSNRDLYDEGWTPTTIMLARNSELRGIPLESNTKVLIEQFAKKGVHFVVGDMPDVDTQFIEYLREIGAKFTIYHAGNSSRINVQDSNRQLTTGLNIPQELYVDYIGAELMKQQCITTLNKLVNEGTITREDVDRFRQMLNDENPSTPEEVEGLMNKFICNL